MRSNKSKPWVGFAVILILGLLTWLPTSATARVQGQCATCHTMHNSQNGASVFAAVQRALLESDCVACHSDGPNTGSNNTPYVDDITGGTPIYGEFGTEATTNTLAGGSFYFMRTGLDDTKGHNVLGVMGVDATISPTNTPPGFDPTIRPLAVNWAGNQLTCAGTYGCHGNPAELDDFAAISGAHHTDDSGGITGATTGLSYRFLDGILGIEMNSDGNRWEYRPTYQLHNQYMGVDRATDTYENVTTISYLCAECHGYFHSGAGDLGTDSDTTFVSPWLRHPTDLDLASATGNTEYLAYPGAFGAPGTYSVVAPVASNQPAVGGIQETVLNDTGDAIVTCISCHRAHGTDYADLLRWDYTTNCEASTGMHSTDCGCFACHTTKD